MIKVIALSKWQNFKTLKPQDNLNHLKNFGNGCMCVKVCHTITRSNNNNNW